MRTQTRWPSSHTLLHWPRQPHSSCSFGPFITSPLSPHSSLRHRHGVSKHLMEFRAVVRFLMFYSEPLTVHNSPQRGGTHGEWKENACIRNMNGVCSSANADCLQCFHTLWPWVMTSICPWRKRNLFDFVRPESGYEWQQPSVALFCPVTEKIAGLLAKSFWHHNLKEARRDTIHIVCTK